MLLYKAMNQPKSLKIICEVLLEQYQKNNLREKMLSILLELIELFPENEKYYQEFRNLKAELGISDEELGMEQASIRVDEAQDIIDSSLAKADLYVEQGLVRNAKRMLENLVMRFPDEPKITKNWNRLKPGLPRSRPKISWANWKPFRRRRQRSSIICLVSTVPIPDARPSEGTTTS